MRLSWNEIRARAATFAQNWDGKGYERGQTQLFYRDFFEVFDVPVGRVASFEEPVKLLGNKRGFIDLLWKGVLLVEQKSIGRDLKKASRQGFDYFPGLKDHEIPRYMMVSDFQTFELRDLESDEVLKFNLADFPQYVEKFGFVVGEERQSFENLAPVTIQASQLMGNLHDQLEESGYIGHDLERLLVRVVFCLFADDTGIFRYRKAFEQFIKSRTSDDGSDVGGWLAALFQTLNTPLKKRATTLDDDLAEFPYINGALFDEKLDLPSFDSKMRKSLLDACAFNWSEVSPAIFGSLFQSVMDRDERRKKGAHYTSEENILKVIDPLFMDDLRVEFKKLKSRKDTHRRKKIEDFQKRLSDMAFFDPACGCGNFLVIAYRELRLLEMEVVRELIEYKRDDHGEFEARLDASELSFVNVDQFYGIEIGEFPVRIAEAAMWMMDHIMNNLLSQEFGHVYVRIPLETAPRIVHGDALELDWETVLPRSKCSVILGNPPFSGSKLQDDELREQVRDIGRLGGSGGTLDFVAAWFIKAGEYVYDSEIRIGFVATSSITNGQQVAQLWPILFDRHKLEIIFAHRAFEWESDASGKAHVHVVIIGLVSRSHAPKVRLLFSYANFSGKPECTRHDTISPYLFDAKNLTDPHFVVKEAKRPINDLSQMVMGSQPIDDGNYIMGTAAERDAFLETEPNAAQFVRPYMGTEEFMNGYVRWILALHDASPETLDGLKEVKKRIRLVREFRRQSNRAGTRLLADTPVLYQLNVMPKEPFLVVPGIIQEHFEYVPAGWIDPPVIPSNLVLVVQETTLPIFALMSSSMHMSWLDCVGGRRGVSYRYSVGMVYNTFPLPPVDEKKLLELEPFAQNILDARSTHRDATMAVLYNPDSMPANLRKAHRELDRKVDSLYLGRRQRGFESNQERSEHLLCLYEGLIAPLTNGGRKPKARRKRTRRA